MPLIELSDAVEVVDGYKRRNPDSWSLCNSIRCDIGELPTISPDEVRGVGKWITKENGKVWWYECSCCGTRPLKSRWANEETLSCYCPNCGARMSSAEAEKATKGD